MKKLLQTLFFFLLVTQICFAQVDDETNIPKQKSDVFPIKLPHATHTPCKAPLSLHPSFYDRKADWQWIIDSTWGSGEQLSGKLATFDLYQNFARSYNSTFLWNSTDWDSLVARLRSKINDSTSRGGFARILNDLADGMKDGHAHAYDDTVFYYTPLDPGIPILVDGSGFINHFGAGLTPLADSSLLVYRVVPNHPLGLEPGDIIIGYEGVPWHQIVHELLDGNVPQSIWRAPSQSAYRRYMLESAGESWHLFDTIDVVKYSTGLTEHLPLDPMVNLVAPDYIINNEQMPVPGVPMPLGYFSDHGAVTYGIIEGTNIGYIYVYHHQYTGVSLEFDAAVEALMETDGLIIDIRVNWGGVVGLNTGISRLINYPTYTLDMMKRCSVGNLYDICLSNQWFISEIPADVETYYDRPVAILIGSGCVSYGDISSWQFTYVPNAKFFGRSPSAAFSGMVLYSQPTRPGYSLRSPDVTFVDHYFPNVVRWGQEFPDFEEVWLTPDGVANGEDDVVNRAVEWMNNLVYPHTVSTDQKYYSQNEDTVHISTIIENPNSHQISAHAYLSTVEGTLLDSVDLFRQTINADGENWGGLFNVPSQEDFYKIGITVFDATSSDDYEVSNATSFTTSGPVTIDSIYVVDNSNYFLIKPFVKNNSTVTTITNASIKLICNDAWVTSITPSIRQMVDIPPEGIVGPALMFRVNVDTSMFPDYFNFKVEVNSDGWQYWIDSMRVPPIAVININPQEIDFGEVAIDSSATKTLTVTNYGDEDLFISNITSSEPAFTLNITNAVVHPDSSQEIEITFTPTLLQTYSGVVEITHNAAGSPDSVIASGNGITGIEDELLNTIPTEFIIYQNYPNPFNPSTLIKFGVPEASKVKLTLFNLLGEEIATLVNEEKTSGYYTVELNAETLSSGVYFYQLKAGSFVETKKMLLLK